jgi:hypothetical protein
LENEMKIEKQIIFVWLLGSRMFFAIFVAKKKKKKKKASQSRVESRLPTTTSVLRRVSHPTIVL